MKYYAEHRDFSGKLVPCGFEEHPSELQVAGRRRYENVREVPEELRDASLAELQRFFRKGG